MQVRDEPAMPIPNDGPVGEDVGSLELSAGGGTVIGDYIIRSKGLATIGNDDLLSPELIRNLGQVAKRRYHTGRAVEVAAGRQRGAGRYG